MRRPARPALAVAVLLALAALPAHADLGGGGSPVRTLWRKTQEEATRERIDEARELLRLYLAAHPPTGMGVDLAGSAGAGGSHRAGGGELSVALAFDVHGDACSLAQAGVLARTSATAGEGGAVTAGLAQWGEICLPGGIVLFQPLVVFPLWIRQDVLLHATPRLTAPRSVPRGPFSEVRWSIATEGLRWPWGAALDRGIAFPGFAVEQAWQWRPLPGDGRAAYELGIDLWWVRFFRHRPPGALSDRHVDVFAISGHGVRDEKGAAIVAFWPVRVQGLGLGDERVLLDARVGFAGTGRMSASTSFDGGSVVDETIETRGLPEVESLVARGAVYAGSPRRNAGVTFDRTLDATPLVDVVREDRVSVWGKVRHRRWDARAVLFGARARYVIDETTRGSERVGGATVDADVAFPGGLVLGLALEGTVPLGARDPVLDGRASDPGVRAMITLSARHNLWRRALAPAAP
jgi:hypothetical protein